MNREACKMRASRFLSCGIKTKIMEAVIMAVSLVLLLRVISNQIHIDA